MTAQRQAATPKRLGLLAPEPPRLARGLDCGLLDVGDGAFEFVGVLGADGDEAGGAQDAVAGGEVGFLLEDVPERDEQTGLRLTRGLPTALRGANSPRRRAVGRIKTATIRP